MEIQPLHGLVGIFVWIVIIIIIFFCKDASYKGKSGFVFDNSFGIYPTFPGTPIINMNWVKNETYAGLNWAKKTFYSPYEFYAFLKELGLNTNSFDYCSEEEKRIEKLKSDSLNKIKNDSLNKIRYEQNVKNYNNRMKQWMIINHLDTTKTFDEWEKEQKNNNSQKKSKIVNGIDLTLEIANSKLTGTDSLNKWLDFDVLVSSNASVYFSNCLLRISYNPSAFGSYIVQNHNVLITKGTAFNTSNYYDPDSNAVDNTSSVMSVPFGDEYSLSYNRTLLTSFNEQLLHFKMKITNI
jgi:hypothetical protein